MSEFIDDSELQRMLDGSLSSEERQLLLQYAEGYPANWRRIALAFIEEQVLRDHLSDYPVADMPPAPDVTSNHLPRPSPSGWTYMLTHAAVICLMLGAGVIVGRASIYESEKDISADGGSGNYTVVVSPVESVLNPQSQSINTPQHKALFSPLFDKRSLDVIRKHGYTATEQHVIFVVQGRQGEQYVVPHHNLSLIAHSN